MSKFPKLIFTCEGEGIYVHGAGRNPIAEVRNLQTGETIGYGPAQLMSIVAQIDLAEWEEVKDEFQSPPNAGLVEPQLSEHDGSLLRSQIRSFLIARNSDLLVRCEGEVTAQQVLQFLFARKNWESLQLPDHLDQGFRRLVREDQIAFINPLLTDVQA